jgi:hypothetical protein
MPMTSSEWRSSTASAGGIKGAAGYRCWTMTIKNLTEMVLAFSNAGVPVVVPETEIRPGVRIAMRYRP